MRRCWFPLLLVALPCLEAADSTTVFTYVRKNCAGCHNAKVKNGDIDLLQYKTPAAFDESREVWEKAVEKIKHGEMPPPNSIKPNPAESTAVTAWLDAEFARQDRTAAPDPGRVTARRLNRTEYNNTIRDLLGVDIRPADGFPSDESAYGFDNIGDALSLSPVLLEKYLHSAERVVRTAVFGPEKLKPAMIHFPAPVRINDTVDKPTLPKDMFHYDESGLSTRHAMHFLYRFPVDGEYNFRLVLNGHRPNGSLPATPAFWIDGKKIKDWEVDATDLEGQIVEVRTKVSAGEHLLSASYLKNYEGLPPSYKGPNPSTRPTEPMINVRGKLTEKDLEILRKYGTKIKTDRIETRIDNRFESLDIGGPFTQPDGPSAASLARVFVCREKTAACAGTIINAFARKAFRRPLAPGEAAPFRNLYQEARRQGDSFEEGITTALEGILVSPHFLFRIEREPKPAAGQAYAPITQYELASRLSYFLWSSMPDETLLGLAAQGRLRQPAVLEAQVKRMLRDQKARALTENFGGQWLQFRNIEVMKPDVERFPEFEDYLRYSMRQETELFVDHLIREDGNLLEILDAKYTYLNERLARFYGIPGIAGPEFRRVDMSQTKRGGGVLAHGSVLTISSYSTRTSPVLRGKWILENLLNSPPPPPPPPVPALDDTKVGQSGTLRQQIEAHRANPTCASCHSRMDPLGFGLENLNAVGAWRDQDGNFPVDPSGTLPGGKTFAGPAELKQWMQSNPEGFLRGVTEKLLTYALGRGLERPDRRIVNGIAAKLPERNYRFSALVLEIVNSLPFNQRRSLAPAGSGAKSE